MTTVPQDEAQRSIADCIAATAKGPELLEQDGQPVAALISWENIDPLCLHPWRGISILTPAPYLALEG